ncbi:MAG: hypothetical protein ACRYFU_25760 [Janthinobacterium lividum]
MRLRFGLPVAVISLSATFAMASPLPMAESSSNAFSMENSDGMHSAKGLLIGAGGTGLVAAVSRMFDNHSSGEAIPAPIHAPEISTSGIVSGIVLLIGGGLIIRGRQQSQA